MNRNGIKGCLLIFVVCLLALLSTKVWAQDIYPTSPPLFTDQELDDLLAPIALYPDPLLAQVLPASTYTEEILDAHDWLSNGASISEIDRPNWDESVKAVAHYPDVLQMMAENADWTADLGDAFLNQPEDVTSSIQRLRWQAKDTGNLQSNSRQTVVIVGNYIEIVPAQPQYIYVPSYDPSVVYEESPYAGGEPFITFGAGFMIGGWLTMDFDWGNHHVIYHGWKRSGWVNHARPYVHVNNVYAHKSRADINKNWRHDASHGTPDSYRTARPGSGSGAGMKSRMSEIRGRSVTAAPSRPSPKMAVPAGDTHSFGNRGKENRGSISSQPKTPSQNVRKQPAITVPDVGKRPATSEQRTIDITQRPAPRTSDISKRPEMSAPEVSKGPPQPRAVDESIQRPKTPSVTFGGYRGASEVRGQSLRGQASRQSSEKRVRPSAAPAVQRNATEVQRSAPAAQRSAPEGKSGSRGNAPEGKRDTGDKQRR
jgi:hypothetical protein